MSQGAGPVSSGGPFQFLLDIPDQCGYQVIGEDGAVIVSAGDLLNKDNFGTTIWKMTHVAHSQRLSKEPFQKITINYDNHFYVITHSGTKIFVVKRGKPGAQENSGQ